MRAIRNTEAGIRTVEVDPPEAGPAEHLVRIGAAGICGSDLHMVEWGPLPFTFGHENAGWLDDGTPVALDPTMPCGVCGPCRRGDTQVCVEGVRALGIDRDGGMADLVAVPGANLVRLPSGLAAGDACLVEPVGVAVHGARRARLQGGMRVAVVGGGTIGLAAVAVATDAGCEVDLVARHSHQRQAGEALGAGMAPASDYDVVFEAAGTSAAMAEAVRRTRSGGKVTMVATYWDGLEVPALEVGMREVTLVPSMGYGCCSGSRDLEAAAALLARRPEVARALITHRFGLDEATEAFRVAAHRREGVIKVVLEP